MIYFDNAASMKPCEYALKAFNDCARCNFSNSSALHKGGIEAEKVINNAKKIILSGLPSAKASLTFTSGATESNNLALLGAKIRQGKIITTIIEHPSVSEPLNELEKRGYEILRISPVHNDNYEEQIVESVDENTVLISVMAVNNETGFIINTKKIYNEIKRKFPKCTVHTDAVQGFLKVPLEGDLISISGHKIGAVKGIGGLFIRDGIKLNPLFFGGGQQEKVRPGTEPAELITAFGAAVENYNYNQKKFTQLSDRLKQHLNEFGCVHINSRNHLPNIINFSVRGVKSEVLLHYFAKNNIYISSGSACAKGKKSKSLLAFGVSPEDADSALRLSFSSENTVEETDEFIKVLKSGIERFRK